MNKKAGRPKKNVRLMQNIRKEAPSSEIKKIEFSSSNILFFKQLMHMLKDIGWIYIYVRFNADDIVFYCNNKDLNGGIIANIPTTSFQLYQCMDPITIECQLYDMDEIFSNINTDYDYFSAIVNNIPAFKAIFYNIKFSEENISIIPANAYFEEPWKPIVDKLGEISNYPLNFTLPIKLLKKRLSSYCKHSNSILLKYVDKVIILEYINANNITNRMIRFTDMINLNISVKDNVNDIVVEFDINNLLSFINNFTNDSILFHVHPSKDLIVQINTASNGVLSLNIPLL
jgi:hypothetical protein